MYNSSPPTVVPAKAKEDIVRVASFPVVVIVLHISSKKHEFSKWFINKNLVLTGYNNKLWKYEFRIFTNSFNQSDCFWQKNRSKIGIQQNLIPYQIVYTRILHCKYIRGNFYSF